MTGFVRAAAGFAYIWVLLMIAIMGAGVGSVAHVWSTHVQREREAELLFIGEEMRRAIGAYFEATPGAARQYPRTLQDLLEDKRYPVVRRYLRRIYRDPFTGSFDWGLVRAPDGGIAGVYSKSATSTFKKKNFKPEHAAFEQAAVHSDWKFIYAAGSAGTPGSTPTPPSPPQSGPVLTPLVPAASPKEGAGAVLAPSAAPQPAPVP